ncbi:hypothetical protein [uncultured Brevundimonas sp.]|uniref:hypothetical protein n=1 Tax=uncultured Brevundimonas sp. TaxID=213418 RepID=UPI0026352528|nr:hypothetical protein [uncultured Brevundimonas sp.]
MPSPEVMAALPGLYADLMARPRMPVVRGFLPVDKALYVFYIQDEPILTGAPPHVNEAELLYPSFRGSISILIGSNPAGADFSNFRSRSVPFGPHQNPPVEARWLTVEDDMTRMILEVYVAQKLGLAVSHPKVREGLERIQPQSDGSDAL